MGKPPNVELHKEAQIISLKTEEQEYFVKNVTGLGLPVLHVLLHQCPLAYRGFWALTSQS